MHHHKHSHLHMHKKEKNWICPEHDECESYKTLGKCPHSIPHEKDVWCKRDGGGCPECIEIEEIINEETFTEEEFTL